MSIRLVTGLSSTDSIIDPEVTHDLMPALHHPPGDPAGTIPGYIPGNRPANHGPVGGPGSSHVTHLKPTQLCSKFPGSCVRLCRWNR